MLQVALRVRADAVEDVLDRLLPRLADGVHQRAAGAGWVELVAYALTRPLPDNHELRELAGPALISVAATEAPDDWRERRRLAGRGVAIADRIWLRSELDPPAAPGMLDVVVERGVAFGTGAHPTTRMCIELLLATEDRRSFADLGCGAGALAIVAARLGFASVAAVDHCAESLEVARANASRNGVDVAVLELDLLTDGVPRAATLAANVPATVHSALAATIPDAAHVLIASGFGPGEQSTVAAGYERRGLSVREERTEGGWVALRMERHDA